MEIIGRQDVPDRRAEGEQWSDMDDLVKGAAAGMRGIRHEGGEGSGQAPTDPQAEIFMETEAADAGGPEGDGPDYVQGHA